MKPPVRVPETLKARQRRASDPQQSVWVSANAGSGKTYVLTERVVRLLLTGVPPDHILCLTYTKAAAAEMRKRVAARLGAWAVADEVTLTRLLTETEGRTPDAATRNRARTLFAHALETPGGLKIMTIHAYCESVLHRFPKEAAVPFDFTVVEDAARAELIARARAEVLADGLNGTGAVAAVEALFDLLSDSQINDAIDAALADQRRLRQILADVPAAKRNLRKLHGVRGSFSREDVLTEMAEGYSLSPGEHAAIVALNDPKPSEQALIEKLKAVDPEAPDTGPLLDAFLTEKGSARARFLTKSGEATLPGMNARLEAEAARLVQLRQQLVVAELLLRSEALLDVLKAISDRYEADKRARSLLDFDDLIAALKRLLSTPGVGQWVGYKLDAGITHILVDEGQDTNAEQWEIIALLSADFFDGEGAAQRLRTVFAVGDKKQSIYSFQGADPELFVDKGREYGFKVQTARMAFDEVPIATSFRTLDQVLRAVDLTFADPALRAGVLATDEAVGHESARADSGGMVTLWPPIQEAEPEIDPDNWATEPPRAATENAARQVANRIAGTIRGWLDNGRQLDTRGRAVTADDVLILVQTRGTLFREIIRALVQRGIPTPGADRLPVTRHIAVLDLIALGDVLSNPADDLQLAALLRSPLFAVSEDDLFAIAHARGHQTTLWAAMMESTLASVAEAARQLSAWRSRLDFDRPYDFYADVLYRGGGLKRFHARLGIEVDDVLGEFLDLALQHEQGPQPSLLGFLADLRSADVTIKRELGEAGGGVRVMTVHGAKGLESPVVILADAASTEAGRNGTPVYLVGGRQPCLIHAGVERQHSPAALEIRREVEADAAREYWRKLYVAMTRAEDELYVTGALTRRGTLEGSWYEAIDRALRPLGGVEVDAAGIETALVFPAGQPPARQGEPAVTAPVEEEMTALAPLPSYALRRIIRPSTAFAEEDGLAALESAAERANARDPEAARREGVALHALLQHLSRIAPDKREIVAHKAIASLLQGDSGRHAAVASRALSILGRPAFAALFGPDSRAEVPLLAQGLRGSAPIMVAGRIDRLVVRPNAVLLVDFKSDAAPPMTFEGVPQQYVRQMGLYARIAGQLFPRHEIRAAILWTELESLMNLPLGPLLEAVESITFK